MFEIMFSDDNLQCDLWYFVDVSCNGDSWHFVDVKGDVSCNVMGDTLLMLRWC
jgi:hypothetical protein